LAFILNITSYIIQTFEKVRTGRTTMREPVLVITENVIKMGVDLLDNLFQQVTGDTDEMGR